MRKHLMAFGVLVILTAGPALADVSAADKKFATEAAQGGLAEVEMGQVAAQKATSPQVKQFAQRMVTDHTEANQELMQVAKSQSLELPTQVDAEHKTSTDKLRGLNGTAFDAAYMQDMVRDHEHTVAAFQKQAQSGSDPALKAFAQKYCQPCNSICRWQKLQQRRAETELASRRRLPPTTLSEHRRQQMAIRVG